MTSKGDEEWIWKSTALALRVRTTDVYHKIYYDAIHVPIPRKGSDI